MKFYHVSVDIFNNIEVFKPRIPSSAMKLEDKSIKRICVSDSIENCLNGIQYATLLKNTLFDSIDDCYEYMDDCNRLVKVYEFEYNGGLIKFPYEINKLVPDSIETQEHWILENIVPRNNYIINITNMNLKPKISSNFDSYEIEKIDYDVVSIEDIAKTVRLMFADENDMVELLDCFSMCVPFQKKGNILELNTVNFPLIKENYKKIMKEYYNWSSLLQVLV